MADEPELPAEFDKVCKNMSDKCLEEAYDKYCLLYPNPFLIPSDKAYGDRVLAHGDINKNELPEGAYFVDSPAIGGPSVFSLGKERIISLDRDKAMKRSEFCLMLYNNMSSNMQKVFLRDSIFVPNRIPVQIISKPNGAEIFVRGVRQKVSTNVQVEMDEKAIGKVLLRLDGYKDCSTDLDVVSSQGITVGTYVPPSSNFKIAKIYCDLIR